jgi:NAD-dependent DNA ligase
VTGYLGIDRERIKAMLSLLGGTYTGFFAANHDLLICPSEVMTEKLNKAVQWNIPVVSQDWLAQSFSSWTKLEYASYLILSKNPEERLNNGPLLDTVSPPENKVIKHDFQKQNKHDIPEELQVAQAAEVPDPFPIEKHRRPRKSTGKRGKQSVDGTAASAVIKENVENISTESSNLSKRKGDVIVVEPTNLETKRMALVPIISSTGIRFSEEDQMAILSIGGRVAKTLEESTHLVAKKISRTEKFLKAIPLGLHIVTEDWLSDSVAVGRFLEESSYPLKDAEMETKFGFSLIESLALAKERKVFHGMVFYIMDKTTPPYKVLEDIIVCAGGKVIKSMVKKKLASDLPLEAVLIHAEDDGPSIAKSFPDRIRHSTEWVLTSVLTQNCN